MAIYHLTVSVGNRAGGHSALSKSDYIQREGKYSDQNRPNFDKSLYAESGNLPEWADSPEVFWKAVDEHERADALLYKQIEMALPRELSHEEHVKLVQDFVREVAKGDKHPFTFSIHEGSGSNPHVHLMVSNRLIDGISRDQEKFFKRANKKDPSRGGTSKDKHFLNRTQLKQVREKWADLVNERLQDKGLDISITHKSFKDRGIDLEPTIHVGFSKEREFENQAIIESRKADLEIKKLKEELQQVETQIQKRTALVSSLENSVMKLRVIYFNTLLKIESARDSFRQGLGKFHQLFQTLKSENERLGFLKESQARLRGTNPANLIGTFKSASPFKMDAPTFERFHQKSIDAVKVAAQTTPVSENPTPQQFLGTVGASVNSILETAPENVGFDFKRSAENAIEHEKSLQRARSLSP